METFVLIVITVVVGGYWLYEMHQRKDILKPDWQIALERSKDIMESANGCPPGITACNEEKRCGLCRLYYIQRGTIRDFGDD